MWQPANPGGTDDSLGIATRLRSRPVALALVFALTVASIGAALAYAPQPARATATAGVGDLAASDVNQTVNGNVSDVRVTATLHYEHHVPDASMRLLKLRVGSSEDNLETVAFVRKDSPAGDASGTVELSASVLDTSVFAASDFDPPVAGEDSTTVVVQAVVEVRRAGGDAVVSRATETVVVTLHDGATLNATVSGDVDVTVVTDE